MTDSTKIHPRAIVDKSAQLANDVAIGPNSVIESGVLIGAGTKIGSNVIIGENVEIGENNEIFSNCIIGGRPQVLGLEMDAKTGGLIIGNRNTIREQVTIHPSMYPDKFTSIGDDNLLMIGVHIGHDCVIEDKIVMSNFVQISGHCKIETGVWFSGMVLLHQFITVGKWCYAAGLAGINRDIPPFLIVSGHYPPVIRGVNRKGLKRAGISEDSQKKILAAYKKLYRGDGSLLEKAKEMTGKDNLDEDVKAMVDAVIKSSQHRFGRYLEQFRH